MKRITLLFAPFLLFGCGEPKTKFSSPFPKKQIINLSKKLGDTLRIANKEDTLTYTILFDKASKKNLITSIPDGDTSFLGYAHKYHGLYFLSRPIDEEESAFYIHALETNGDSIKGWETEYFQMLLVDTLSQLPEYAMEQTVIDSNSVAIDPEKRRLLKLYSAVLDSLPAFPIIQDSPPVTLDTENPEALAVIYPNPATEYCHIDLKKEGEYLLEITHQGNILHSQTIKTNTARVNLSDMPKGMVQCRISSLEGKDHIVKTLIIR